MMILISVNWKKNIYNLKAVNNNVNALLHVQC